MKRVLLTLLSMILLYSIAIAQQTTFIEKDKNSEVGLINMGKNNSSKKGQQYQSFRITQNNKKKAGISVRISTLGFGSELVGSFHPKWNVRLGFNIFSYKYSGKDVENDVSYDADLKLQSLTLLLDWYPSGRTFRISGGLVNNLNNIDLLIGSTKSYEIGVKTYSPDKIGKINGKIDFDKFAPYIGFGWGNSLTNSFALVFDIGMFYQNSPYVNFKADGMIEQTADQDQVVEESLAGWKAYGVISFGFVYKIF